MRPLSNRTLLDLAAGAPSARVKSSDTTARRHTVPHARLPHTTVQLDTVNKFKNNMLLAMSSVFADKGWAGFTAGYFGVQVRPLARLEMRRCPCSGSHPGTPTPLYFGVQVRPLARLEMTTFTHIQAPQPQPQPLGACPTALFRCASNGSFSVRVERLFFGACPTALCSSSNSTC